MSPACVCHASDPANLEKGLMTGSTSFTLTRSRVSRASVGQRIRGIIFQCNEVYGKFSSVLPYNCLFRPELNATQQNNPESNQDKLSFGSRTLQEFPTHNAIHIDSID
jgi:hypothetical protein